MSFLSLNGFKYIKHTFSTYLLSIDNEDWRECEQQLKEFLEEERAKMKERSMRIPTPYSSDPGDILNIVRAR